VAFNAPLGWGEQLETIVPKWKVNWSYPLELTDEDKAFGIRIRNQGEYIPVWFCGHSFYKGWLNKFTISQIHDLIDDLGTHGHVILTGAKWDKPFMRQFKRGDVSDLTGLTSMGSLLGLLKYAKAYVGHAAGQGMLAQHMGTKTFLLWDPHQWKPAFMNNWVAAGKIKTVYHALDIRQPCTPYILENL
jgi:ADP-heptose:LPS heptosyltransferase